MNPDPITPSTVFKKEGGIESSFLDDVLKDLKNSAAEYIKKHGLTHAENASPKFVYEIGFYEALEHFKPFLLSYGTKIREEVNQIYKTREEAYQEGAAAERERIAGEIKQRIERLENNTTGILTKGQIHVAVNALRDALALLKETKNEHEN